MSDSRRYRPVCFSLFLMASVVATCSFGANEASYRIRGGDLPIDHSVNGYSQSVEDLGEGVVLVRVTVLAEAIGSDPSGYEPDSRILATLPEGFELPQRLESFLSPDLDAFSRATRVLRWVGRSLSIDNSGQGDQDAVSVLRRGNGRCSGLANAAVALLRAAGFRARTVSGLLISNDRIVPHRWLECLLPGAGWVPTDPTIGFWVMTPRHLVFPGTVDDLPVVDVVSLVEAPASFPLVEGVQARPDQGSELVFRVINPCGGKVTAILRSSDGVEKQALLGEKGRVSRLLPGRWRLEVRRNEDVVFRQTLKLGAGAHHSVVVSIDEEDCS